VWQTYGRCFAGMLRIERGALDAGVTMLTAAVDELRRARYVQYATALLAALAAAFASAGQAARGLAVADEALASLDASDERWIVAEVLRLKGELVLLHDVPDATAVAEDHFRQSLEWAARQGALAWELRTTMSLARLRHRQRKTSDARKLLTAVYERFTEGFDTTDLVGAKALLRTLRGF
jgi:predicted ATPase